MTYLEPKYIIKLQTDGWNIIELIRNEGERYES